MRLELLPGSYAVCRLDAAEPVPVWATGATGAGEGDAGPAALHSLTRTHEEVSIVCEEALVPPDRDRAGNRRALRVSGTLDHSMTGVLSALAAPLAAAGVPVFALSTWDTDYLLVPGNSLGAARDALLAAGHTIAGG